MLNGKRFTKDEIDILSKSPYVKNIRENRLTFTYEFRCILYNEWIKSPTVVQIRKVLTSYNFNCVMIGYKVVNRIHRDFKRNGRPSRGKNKSFGIHELLAEKYDDSYLVDSGVFIKSGIGVRFTSEFIDQVYKEYPEVSIESQLESYGLDPKRVGYQRIYKLKNLLEDINPHNENYDSDIINRYIHHPYVQRCTSKQLVLNNSFYNEASRFKDLPIDEVLGIFEINGSDLPIGVRNRIQYKLNNWNVESLDVTDKVDLDFILRIQYNKIQALEKISLMHFNRLRNNLPHYTFNQKKVLCMWIKDLPHDRYDYSIQSILKKIGLSRSSYYSILSNDNYGMKDKQDEIDFAMIRVGYRGAQEGILHEDAYFNTNMQAAIQNKIKVGAYFFSSAITEDEIDEEVNMVLNEIRNYKIDMPIVFDMEEFEKGGRIDNLTQEQRTNLALRFCGKIKKAGYDPMIYGNMTWLYQNYDFEKISEYPIWLASYSSDCPMEDKFEMWQYSNIGQVNGIEGDVDINIYLQKK